jgi:hypothetical protein
MSILYSRLAGVFAVLTLLFNSSSAPCGTVVLKRAFVMKYKDRATIDASFFVDHAHKGANPPAKDGDLHVAGRAPKEIGLPVVAEVVNAARTQEQVAVSRIHAVEGNGSPVPVSGAWRLWFEHPADSQTQFDSVPVAANTNPDHSFEIHPITRFDGDDLSTSFQQIPGFQPYPASKAFASYEQMAVILSATPSAVSITSKKSGYNYVQFRIQLKGTPKRLADDGYAVLADVFDTGSKDTEESIADNIRMIFVPNTPPLQQLISRKLGDGDSLNVIGIPRVNLNAIDAFLTASSDQALLDNCPMK